MEIIIGLYIAITIIATGAFYVFGWYRIEDYDDYYDRIAIKKTMARLSLLFPILVPFMIPICLWILVKYLWKMAFPKDEEIE